MVILKDSAVIGMVSIVNKSFMKDQITIMSVFTRKIEDIEKRT